MFNTLITFTVIYNMSNYFTTYTMSKNYKILIFFSIENNKQWNFFLENVNVVFFSKLNCHSYILNPLLIDNLYVRAVRGQKHRTTLNIEIW